MGGSRGKSSQAGSRTRYFQRWLNNPKVQVQSLYAPLVRAALIHWQAVGRICFARDVSVIRGSLFVLIRVFLIYRGQTIPLAWRVIRHTSAMVGYADYRPVLEAAKMLFPRKEVHIPQYNRLEIDLSTRRIYSYKMLLEGTI